MTVLEHKLIVLAAAAEMEKQLHQQDHEALSLDIPGHALGQAALGIATLSTSTPPMRPEFSDRLAQSPSASSSHSSTSAAPYFGGPINSMESHQQRQPPPSSHPGPGAPPPTSQSPYQNSPFPPSPTGMQSYTYPSPAHHPVPPAGLYYQRPLPSTFPPANIPPTIASSMSVPPDGSQMDPSNPWQHQHHHYISPASSGGFAGQSQDRYVCQTCNKAFSRPSSLKIHSHSHTGEKPFKCPHPGCEKAFSVRSNMKRHERGCHGGGASPGSQ